MLLDVTRERLHVVMNQRIPQLCRRAFDDDVLMHFHVRHGSILIFQAAFITSLAVGEIMTSFHKPDIAVAQEPARETMCEAGWNSH